MTEDIFELAGTQRKKEMSPLADRMRPANLSEYVGQQHILGEGRMLRDAVESDQIPSMIFWGPPGSGKTTLATLIAVQTDSYFVKLPAVSSGVKEIREAVAAAGERLALHGERTIVFIDEIHRFNKSQQDALLPFVEDGTITLIGATTENPSFEVNSALLSRCRVFILEALSADDISVLIRRALTDKKRGLGAANITMDDDTITFLAGMANGDARVALNALELAARTAKKTKSGAKVDKDRVKESLQRTHVMYDKGGEEHYNIISALHKSMRGSDPDAALYWLGRMLEGGEDPLYVARRLIRFASEDVGLADSHALPLAVAAYQASHFIGMPECGVVLAHCAAYLAKAKKSIAVYRAYNEVRHDINQNQNEGVPLHLRNAPTKLMKEVGYGKGYKYTPDYDPEDAKQDYLPNSLRGKKYLQE
jgi:putative ATPase